VRRRTVLLLAANAVAVGAFLWADGWDAIQLYTGAGLPERTGPPMELIAHRGDLDRYPENTLEAIEAATELPVEGIEFDVVMSADGTWWVIHDPTLDRTTDGTGPLSGASDEDIRSAVIDDGIGFDADRHQGLRVPSLSDVLAALEDYAGTLYVDVQHAPTGEVDDIVALLDGFEAAVLCRDLADTRRVKELDPSVGTYLRVEDGPADETVDGWLMEAFFEADVSVVQASELPVITFVDQWRAGESEAAALRRAWAAGVTGFITKQPSAAAATRSDLMPSGDLP
jgi:glycerophosphoryl diester phosphodiesterase